MKILIGLALLVLLGGIIGCSVTPTPTPPPTTTPPPTPGNGVIKVTAQEFIVNAQAGKYKAGTIIEVSGVYYETRIVNIIMYVIFGPQTNGLKIVAEPDEYDRNYIGFASLNSMKEIIIRGEYKGIGRINAYPYQNGPDFVILTKVKLITAGK